MKTSFGFIDPGAIIGVVIALIILGVGTFAFFVVINQVDNLAPAAGTDYGAASNVTNAARYQWLTQNGNTSNTGNSVFNIIGVILIVGAIMSIVGLVYNYVR